MMDDWLDKWLTVRRADPRTDRKPAQYRMPCEPTFADTIPVECGPHVIPTSVPLEYDDPVAQAAYEAVYRNRLWALRVPTPLTALEAEMGAAAV
jgi:hypothetical protein